MGSLKKQRREPSAGDGDEDPLAKSLAAYGEKFMQMFEDYRPPAAARSRSKPTPTGSGQKEGSQKQRGKAAQAPGPEAAAPPPRLPAKRERPVDEIGEIMLSAMRAREAPSVDASMYGSGRSGLSGRAGPSGRPGGKPTIDVRSERRAFMSHKAGKVHSAGPTQAKAQEAGSQEIDPTLSPEEFRKLQMEVERLGASALDKKQRKKWQAQFLERLGAKAEKGPRTPANIGLGMAKKQAQREARALEEAIASGVVRVKGMGKKKQALKDQQWDRGLMEAGNNFKNGILKVKKPQAPQKARPLGKKPAGKKPAKKKLVRKKKR